MTVEEGRVAFANGDPLASCPYSKAQGSPTRVRAIAWISAYRAAQAEAEIAEQEADGHFRSTTGG